MQKNLLNSNIFAFYLTPAGKGEPELTFGYYDPRKFFGKIDWHPVTKKEMWTVKLDDIKVNGVSLKLS